jgi:hypothetical protein
LKADFDCVGFCTVVNPVFAVWLGMTTAFSTAGAESTAMRGSAITSLANRLRIQLMQSI